MSRARGVVLAFLCGALLLTVPVAGAADGRIVKTGACSFGPSSWKLVTRQFDASTLLVRVEISGGAPDQSWTMFVTDNGAKVIRNTKVADGAGFARWVRKTPDRAGADLIEMAANNGAGEICSGSLSF